MVPFALTHNGQHILIIGAIIAAGWLLAAVATAEHGANRGFPFWPLLLCSLFLGFPLVLLAITIGAPIRNAIRETTLAIDDLQEDPAETP